MKASLASATSVAALLAFQANPAQATLFTLNTTTLNFGDVLVGHSSATTQTVTLTDTASSGTLSGNFAKASAPFSGTQKNYSGLTTGKTATSSPYNFTATSAGATGSQTWTTTVAVFGQDGSATQTTNVTLTGVAVAPIERVDSASNNATINDYVLVGTTGTATVTVQNIGHGNLAGADSKTFQSNLHGTVGAGNSVITGSGGTVNLTDSSSTSFNYTYAGATLKGNTGSAVITTSFTNGSPVGSNDAFTNTTTIVATAVAPVNSVSTTGTLARFNTKGVAGANSTTSSTAVVTVANVGNGNLATGGPSPTSNLNGSVTSPGASVFAGPTSGSPFSLPDSTSTNVNYTFSPITRSIDTTGVTANFTNGNTNLKNTSQAVGVVLSGQGVGPTYNSALGTTAANAHSNFIATTYNTPTPNTGSSPVAFGKVGTNTFHTLYLDIGNTSTDPNGGNSLLTDLSLESFTITGAQASNYSIPGGTTPQVLHEGNDIVVPITFHAGSKSGAYVASLTFITDESVGYGALGDTFTYALSGSVLAPEPASLLLLSVGLGGVFYVRKRRSLT
jgi:hypothetical protein